MRTQTYDTPYSQWTDRCNLKQAFIIDNACNEEWVMVEMDINASSNYSNRIARCRWYISGNIIMGNELTVLERIPETDEMLCERICNIVEDFTHPNIRCMDRDLLETTYTHDTPIIEWKIDAEKFKVHTGDDDDLITLFLDIPQTCTYPQK